MYACRLSLGALSLFPVTHPAVVAVPFTRPSPTRPLLPCHALHGAHTCITRRTMCVQAHAPYVTWVRAVCAS